MSTRGTAYWSALYTTGPFSFYGLGLSSPTEEIRFVVFLLSRFETERRPVYKFGLEFWIRTRDFQESVWKTHPLGNEAPVSESDADDDVDVDSDDDDDSDDFDVSAYDVGTKYWPTYWCQPFILVLAL